MMARKKKAKNPPHTDRFANLAAHRPAERDKERARWDGGKATSPVEETLAYINSFKPTASDRK